MKYEENRLPTMDIIMAAFSLCYANRFTLVKTLLISGMSLLAIDLYVTYIINYDNTEPHSIPLILAAYLLWSAVFTIYAINCHRMFLLEPSSIPKYGIIQWRRRELFFLLWGIMLALITVAPILIISYLPAHFIIIGMGSFILLLMPLLQLSGFYIFSRLSINLPAIAIDKKRTLKQAWHLSRGNGWRLSIITGILPIAFSLWNGFVNGKSFFLDIFLILFGLILLAVEIAALSLSYKFLTQSTKSQHQS